MSYRLPGVRCNNHHRLALNSRAISSLTGGRASEMQGRAPSEGFRGGPFLPPPVLGAPRTLPWLPSPPRLHMASSPVCVLTSYKDTSHWT